MKGADTNGGSSGGGGGGNSNGNTYSRSLAEIQNHHNDSQEQLSPPPGPRSKHDEAYSVDEPYEICPYATFSMPPGTTVPPGSAGRGTLDYTLQFHTFGHQECFEGQPAPQRASAASLLGGRRRDGGGGSAAGASVGKTLPHPPPPQAPIPSIPSPPNVTLLSFPNPPLPSRSSSRGADFSFHPPDSSTESNDERSPVPPRRPQHLPPTHPQHASHRLHACTPAPPPAQGLRPSSTLDSVYSVEGAVGGPLRPPTGFSDSRELSEAECDRDPGQGGPKGRPQQHGRMSDV
ncbi:hypothetical protein E2C01_034916 [Portunus trituberculatus]|uniref:Uncharacterized protein n=1 Tax=Portunus trituberculatus TaxID=210409 RepID=A0A5B7F884_PORTR|nr:hypothetical protein [Portunus trituberculatus]